MATATTRRKASLSSAKRINVVIVVIVVVKSTMSSEAAKNVNITSYYSPEGRGTITLRTYFGNDWPIALICSGPMPQQPPIISAPKSIHSFTIVAQEDSSERPDQVLLSAW